MFERDVNSHFSENLHFVPPDTHMHVWNDSFSENFAHILNEWSLTKRQSANDNGVKLKVRHENQI